MSPEDFLAQEVAEWLARARADSDACTVLIAAGLYAEALYHAQQCAEKALKANLTRAQSPFIKTHDLLKLKEFCVAVHPQLAAALTEIELLSRYAWQFRYPGAPYEPELSEAEDARFKVASLLHSVKPYCSE